MRIEEFVLLALSYLNFPAVNYGGPSKGAEQRGFDCSGFIGFVLKEAGFNQAVPRHASELFDSFGILIHEQFKRSGDLVFFSNRGGTYPDHVGIMISKDEYIHSPGRNGRVICINKLKQEIISQKNEKLQIYFSNPIGLKRITINNGRYRQLFLSE